MATSAIKSTKDVELILLYSKSRVPVVAADVVPRQRLFRLLDGWQANRLTAIQAPPGYGKTMLVASWLRDRWPVSAAGNVDVAWINLDEDDDEPRQFAAYLAAALRPIIPSAALAVEQNLRHGLSNLHQSVKILLNGIELHGSPILLVVDDSHHIQDERIQNALELIVKRGPANLHLMLISQRNLPPVLGHLGGIGGLSLLGVDDLRFHEDEIDLLVVRTLGLGHPSATELSMVATRSGGWIAGLKLAALALPRGADLSSYVALLHGRNQWLSGYFLVEILDRQPANMQRFLLEISVLDQFTASLCAATSRSPEAAMLLQQAAGRFFVAPVGAGMSRFTYNDLFRDILRNELDRRYPPEEVQRLCARAAQWLEEHAEIDAALRQYLAVRLSDQAVSLAERHCLSTILSGDINRAQHWITQLQDNNIALTPRLMLDRGWLYLMTDRLDTLEMLHTTDHEWQCLSASTALHKEMNLERLLQLGIAHFLAGQRQTALEVAEQVAGALSADSHFLVRGSCHFLKLVALTAQPREAQKHGTLALEIYQQHGWLAGMASVTRSLSDLARRTGDAQTALTMGRRAQRLLKAGRQEQTLEAVYVHFQLAHLLYALDHLDEARVELHSLISKAELLGETVWELMGTFLSNLCDLAEGRLPSFALQADTRTLQSMLLDEKPSRQALVWSWMIRCWIRAGESAKAFDAARQLHIRPDSWPHGYLPLVAIGYVSGYLAHGRKLKYIKFILAELVEHFCDLDNAELQLQASVLQAWYHVKSGDTDAAKVHLGQALDLAVQTGYVRHALDVPELDPLLADMHHPALAQHPEYRTAAYGAKILPDLTDQEAAILCLLAKRRTNAEIASEMVLTVSTVKWHLWNMYRKMRVKNRRAAVARAGDLGLFD